MITDALLNILKAVIEWVISVRPSLDIDPPAGAGEVFGRMKGFDAVVPVTETLVVVGVVVFVVGGLLLWKWTIKLVDWIAAVIP